MFVCFVFRKGHNICPTPCCSTLSPIQIYKSFIPPPLNRASRQVVATGVLAEDGEVGRARRVSLHRGEHVDGMSARAR